MTEEARYRVLIRDPLGKVVFVAVTQPGSEPVTPSTVPLAVGTYLVECHGRSRTNVAEPRVFEGS